MNETELTWEEAISTFTAAEEDEQTSAWIKARTAAAVEDRFGGSDRKARATALVRFAGEVRYSASTLRKYARTARFFPPGTNVLDLSFTMHRIAANHSPTPQAAQAALALAAAKEWSTRQLQDHLVQLFGLKMKGLLEETADERLLLDKQDLVDLLRQFDGLRVRLQVKVTAEEE